MYIIVHEALPSQLKYVGDFNALKAKHRKKKLASVQGIGLRRPMSML